MNRRVLLFFVLSFLVIQLTAWWTTPPHDPNAAKQGAKGEAAAVADAKDDVAAAVAADRDAPNEDADQEPDQEALAERPEQPAADADEDAPNSLVTLGSIDEASGYRMLVTLTNSGAAVKRVELSDQRFLDLHDLSGYLGHLEAVADGGTGLLVQAVGQGTPADKAGLRSGDRLLEAGRDKTQPLAKPEDLAAVLAATKPRQKVSLLIERDGARQTLTATLERRPLEVIRPEAENVVMRLNKLPAGFEAPPSFLLTLQRVDEDEIAKDKNSLADVDLDSANWRVVPPQGKDDGSSVTFERRVPKYGLVVTKRYQLNKAPAGDGAKGDAGKADAKAPTPGYDLSLEVSIRNEGGDASREVSYRLDGPNGLPIEGWWYATKVSGVGLRDIVGRYFGAASFMLGAVPTAQGDVEDVEGAAIAYMGVDAQYFCAALMPVIDSVEEGWVPRARSVIAGSLPDLARSEGKFANATYQLFSKPVKLAPGETTSNKYTVFIGPKRPEMLARYYADSAPGYSINDFVDYGWFDIVARGMIGLLHFFYGFVGNYGIAIIMLTVLVRGCMFPVSRGQARSMAKLQALRPEMDRIKEKYKGDQQKQAQAMQQLYRKHKVNPLGGCLPALIQLPVFIGLYRGLAVDVELRGSALFSESIRWCSNLAAPDMLYDWSAFMPKLIQDYLGPYLNILPLVTIALFLLQQKMFMPEPQNEQAAMQQKVMTYVMIFMGVLFYKVPSGLCLYFIASSLWGITERKMIPPPAGEIVAAGGPEPVPAGGDKRGGKNGRSGGRPNGKGRNR